VFLFKNDQLVRVLKNRQRNEAHRDKEANEAKEAHDRVVQDHKVTLVVPQLDVEDQVAHPRSTCRESKTKKPSHRSNKKIK
jgi:hypothetical protein